MLAMFQLGYSPGGHEDGRRIDRRPSGGPTVHASGSRQAGVTPPTQTWPRHPRDRDTDCRAAGREVAHGTGGDGRPGVG